MDTGPCVMPSEVSGRGCRHMNGKRGYRYQNDSSPAFQINRKLGRVFVNNVQFYTQVTDNMLLAVGCVFTHIIFQQVFDTLLL